MTREEMLKEIEAAQNAGLVIEVKREKYDIDFTKSLLEETLKNFDFGDYEVEVLPQPSFVAGYEDYLKDNLHNLRSVNLSFSQIDKAIAGLTANNYDPVVAAKKIYFFYVGIYNGTVVKDRDHIQDTINQIIRHEMRHAAQFNYLDDKGGETLINKVAELDEKSDYGMGVLEADAISHQKENYMSLKEASHDIEKWFDSIEF